MCCDSGSDDIAARLSTEYGVVAIHTFLPEQEFWDLSIFNSGDCECAVRCNWTFRPVAVDRSRFDPDVTRDLALNAIPGMTAKFNENVSHLQELRIEQLNQLVQSNDWDSLICDEMPDIIFAQIVGLNVNDGFEFNELLEFRDEYPENFKVMYPGTLGINL
jgi:hypothetical protein